MESFIINTIVISKDVKASNRRTLHRPGHPFPGLPSGQVHAARFVGVALEGFDDLLELGHPRLGEVAVLQHDPAALLDRLGDHARGDRPLPLPERDGARLLPAEAARLGELEQRVDRVGRVVEAGPLRTAFFGAYSLLMVRPGGSSVAGGHARRCESCSWQPA